MPAEPLVPSPPAAPRLSVAARIVILSMFMLPLAVSGMARLASARSAEQAEVERARTTPPPTLHFTEQGVPKPLIGFAINAHHISDLRLYLDGVDAIADLGANTLIVLTPGYQEKVSSTRIRTLRNRCPTEEQLLAIFERARRRGLYTILMPIVLIEDPGPEDWRGVLAPEDLEKWWASYGTFMEHFADVARRARVDLMSVGSELNSMERELDRWEEIVQRVRERFTGKLTYSANWDRYDKTALWSLVDVMSVSSYFELERDRHDAPEDDLVEAWMAPREALLAAAEKWDRPLLLSEVGYPSLEWSAAHPWNYVAKPGMQGDPEAQARAWRAFFRAWTPAISNPDEPVIGVCGYRWDPYNRGGVDDTGYGLIGKPAHDVVRAGFAAIEQAGDRSRTVGVPELPQP